MNEINIESSQQSNNSIPVLNAICENNLARSQNAEFLRTNKYKYESDKKENTNDIAYHPVLKNNINSKNNSYKHLNMCNELSNRFF